MSWTGGNESPKHTIACIGSESSLIIAEFIFNKSTHQVIIDTGATGSFIPSRGSIALANRNAIRPIVIQARTADNALLRIEAELTINVSPNVPGIEPKRANILILPGRSEILGYHAIIGLDIIKAYNIRIAQLEDKMCAVCQDTIIGHQSSQPTSLATVEQIIEHQTQVNTAAIDKLITEYSDTFAESATTLIKTSPMPIPLVSDSLVKVKLRRHSIEDINEMHRQIKILLQNGIIEKSQSSFSSNAHLVPKKTGQKRMVVNFIPLNAISAKDHYPMPQLSDLFNALYGAKYFAALDCTEGFFQIPLLPEHRERTAFITPHGLYHFKRCPFGYTNSPAQFQRTMNDIFEEGLYKRCVIYIDDILVFGQTEEELATNLRWVLERCRSRCVKLKKSKCKFLEERVEFLGFIVTHNQISPIPGKNDPLLKLVPTCKTDILTILGTLNYYARFIPNYVERTKEIRAIAKKDASFRWTPEMAREVEKMVKDINNPEPHYIPDSYSSKTIELAVRNSSIEVTCFSAQNKIISRAGITLGQSQLNYTKVEKQLLGLVLAYEKFKSFMRGPVTVKTTCKELISALKLKERPNRIERLMLKLPPDINFEVELLPNTNETESYLNSDCPPEEVFYTDGACTSNGKPNCLASWAVLSTMNPSLSSVGLVEHPKPSNQVAELTAIINACNIAKEANLKDIVIFTDSKYCANAINRWIDVWNENGWKDNRNKPVMNERLLKELSDYRNQLKIRCHHVKGHSDDFNNDRVDRMARERLVQSLPACLTISSRPPVDQNRDEALKKLIEQLPKDPNLQKDHELIEGKLYYVDNKRPALERHRLYVPESSRELLLRIAHDDPVYGGHLGSKKTRKKLAQYYWPGMPNAIDEYIKTCETCQKYKTPKGPKPGLLKPIGISSLFERVHLDIIGPIHETRSRNRYIITAIDSFSRYAYARSLPSVKVADIMKFLREEILSKHGIPDKIVTDNGPQFISDEFGLFVQKLNIKHSRTCDYHPEANGMDERFNGSLVKILKNYVDSNQNNWDEKMIWALMLYNTTPHESTQMSPYTILYGKNPRSPLTLPLVENSDVRTSFSNHEDIRAFARTNMLAAQASQKRYFDLKRKPQDFQIFDLVMLRSHAPPRGLSKKLAPTWKGPYTVLKLLYHETGEPQAVELLDLLKFKTKRATFQDLKHFHERTNRYDDSSSEQSEEILPGIAIDAAIEAASTEESEETTCIRGLAASGSEPPTRTASELGDECGEQHLEKDVEESPIGAPVSELPNWDLSPPPLTQKEVAEKTGPITDPTRDRANWDHTTSVDSPEKNTDISHITDLTLAHGAPQATPEQSGNAQGDSLTELEKSTLQPQTPIVVPTRVPTDWELESAVSTITGDRPNSQGPIAAPDRGRTDWEPLDPQDLVLRNRSSTLKEAEEVSSKSTSQPDLSQTDLTSRSDRPRRTTRAPKRYQQ